MPCYPSLYFSDKHSAYTIHDFKYVGKNTNSSEASKTFVRENTQAEKMLQGIRDKQNPLDCLDAY